MEGFYQFLENNSIFIVMIIVLLVWAGVFFYLLNLDKRIKKVEKEMNGETKNEK